MAANGPILFNKDIRIPIEQTIIYRLDGFESFLQQLGQRLQVEKPTNDHDSLRVAFCLHDLFPHNTLTLSMPFLNLLWRMRLIPIVVRYLHGIKVFV